jgi:hypothetical protein
VFNGVPFVVPVPGLAVRALGGAPARARTEHVAAAVRIVNAEPDQQAGKACGPSLSRAVPVQQGRQRNVRTLLPVSAGLPGCQQFRYVRGIVVALTGIAEGCGGEAG